jgi:hypothetical protein
VFRLGHLPQEDCKGGISISIVYLGNPVAHRCAAGTPAFGLGVTITQIVPEPMTMALLGLGGLFLRRRCK